MAVHSTPESALVQASPMTPAGQETADEGNAFKGQLAGLDAYRSRAQAIVKSADSLAAELLLMDMPDLDLPCLIELGDRLLVELVLLGDPDRLRRRLPAQPVPTCFALALKNRDWPMVATLLRHGIPVPADYSVLADAVRAGDLETVKGFIKVVSNVGGNNKYWSGSALHDALYFGHDAIVDALLEAGVDVNAEASIGGTPLHTTALTGNIAYAARLLERGARPDAVLQDGRTPLHHSIWCGNLEFACWFATRSGIMDAHIAAGLGDLETVRRLYPEPTALDRAMPCAPSPVFWAAMADQLPIVEYFCAAGVDVNLTNKYCSNLLSLAAGCGANAVVTFLLSKGGKPCLVPPPYPLIGWDCSALHEAARGGHLETMAMLLVHGMDVDYTDSSAPRTALSIAAATNQLEAIRFLAKRGANLDGPSGSSNPLCDAICHGHLAACRLLLELGANPNGAEGPPNTQHKTSPLAWAATSGKSEFFELLLKYGADPRTLRGGEALQHCASGGDPGVVLRLIQLGADVNFRQGNDDSPLMRSLRALDKSCEESALALLKAGARFTEDDNDKLAMYAGSAGSVKVMQALVDRGLKLRNASESQSGGKGLNSALACAAVANRKDLVRFLISRGMKIEAPQDGDERSLVLVQAARAGAKLAVLELIKAGAGRELRVSDGSKTRVINPLSVAASQAAAEGHMDTFRALLRHGAVPTAEEAKSARQRVRFLG